MAEVVNISALKPGMVILRITAQNGPVNIRKSGLVSSQEMIQGLAEMGVLEVEIDPAQTVEVEQPVITKSKTQQLLDRENPSTTGFDHQLSEQFNRSLFLPSVQEIPSSLQVHLKQALTFAVVIMGGFGLGWTGANADKWLKILTQPATHVAQLAEPASQEPESSELAAPLSSATAPESGSQRAAENVGQVNVATVEQEQPVASLPSEQVSDSAGQMTEATEAEPEPLILGYRPEQAQLDLSGESTGQSNEGLSPELLRRFEQAVAQLDSEPQQDFSSVPVDQPDVPMIHELPAWVLTDLPSMAFSAHMYASTPSERWIRVNGRRVEEGQQIEEGLRLVSIEPQHVILAFKGQTFSISALTDW